ncbi:MAG: SHOCT domain-containing protein [Planctomycetota bacterium]|nr:SHOCT domain-containing protein [Planctomycetota bacterium]
MEPPEVKTVMSPDQLMALVMVCVVALLAIFVLLAWVRMWGQRVQKQGGGCGSLDIEAVRRQRDAGEITQEEFDRILGGIAGSGADTATRSASAGSQEEKRP